MRDHPQAVGRRDTSGPYPKAGEEAAAAVRARSGNANNPYHRFAGLYDRHLSLPVISAIRRQEKRIILDLMERHARPADRALEVGPGTGFYTVALSRKVARVVAVEESEMMSGILRGRLAAAGASNVEVINQDFAALPTDGEFDLAAAIGVLDYISDPVAFVAKLCAAAGRAVIFTVPQRGLWGRCFAAGGRLRKTAIYCYDRSAPGAWAPGWWCSIAEVGLKTRLTRGLTLVAALERPH